MAGKDSDASKDIIERLVKLRISCFGSRGRGKFAKLLGTRQSTYSYYEHARVPPAQILVRASEVTGCSLKWLLTGAGEMFEDRSASDASGEQAGQDTTGTAGGAMAGKEAQEAVERLISVMGNSPKAAAAIRAFAEVMEQAQQRQAGGLEDRRGQRTDDIVGDEPISEQGGQGKQRLMLTVPVLGRVAAGIPMFWADEGQRQTFADLRKLACEAARSGGCDVIWRGSGGEEFPEVELMQLPKVRQLGSVLVSELVRFSAWTQGEGEGLFAAWVDGDSMSPMVHQGDLIVVSSEVPADDGKIAVVQLDGQIGCTCKLYRRQGKEVYLTPANEAYATTIHPADGVLWALKVLFRIKLQE